jgi:hypothetical protein
MLMTKKNSLITKDDAARLIGDLGEDFALIPNAEYIHPRYEIVPLAPKRTTSAGPLVAVVMDMDGTTTTTEELCIHSLEFMLRKISGRMNPDEWAGLDHVLDYPNIIGNSTTKHVEFLITKYASMIDANHLRRSYLYSALWTIVLGQDAQRIAEVKNNLANLGCREMLSDDRLTELAASQQAVPAAIEELLESFLPAYGASFQAATPSAMVRAGIDIYYQTYHAILMEIQTGKGEELARQFLGNAERRLIEPMPGIGLALSLMKGWLGEDAGAAFDDLAGEFAPTTGTHGDAAMLAASRKNLAALGVYFERHPLKISVVTSSIHYEANIIMSEVCSVIQQQIGHWNIPDERKKRLRQKFSSYRNVYDGFVTANDSSEIRLKPHRDLYSIALHVLGIPKEQFDRVAGFEDSESGTFAIRAAGIGLCIAVPFEKSKGHNLDAASLILPGGVPEAVIVHNLFMQL